MKLETKAELKALEAENLPTFQGVKLLHIKNTVRELLSLIGREGLFSEYSKHDISHIDAMLGLLDWLIPEATAEEMTPADWLMLVLSIYLHDLGMVVTKDEYENRPRTRLDQFRDESLFQGDDGADYQARLDALTPDEQDRFVYEEFIRETHGQRVRAWLADETNAALGESKLIQAEVARLAEPLPPLFRRDLGLVCESHHLDDLGDIAKYPLDKPYGNNPGESVNLQYAAVLLRTADLLHITADRTPPVLFRVINPTNPVSQGEWVKQKAVRAIRSQPKRDEDGELDSSIPSDTVEVFADFDDPDGFFGLTSYLVYAQRQLQRSNEWINASAKRTTRPYSFPWRSIDDTSVETLGYLPRPYEFTIDQQRVLDLLTGHTLYNQTDVVVRELVQNSLDAVRLQATEEDSKWSGRVLVEYDSENRVLHVTDNGTGMTQAMIEQHLLRVGSSRYQDPEFRKQHPEFSAISRFGIGVLSAFMVADRVQVVTANLDEDEARELTLRTVHGRYLIRLLAKDQSEPVSKVLPHGTRVSLWLRPSAKLGDVLDVVRSWIVVPRCQVSVIVDDGEPEEVGFATPSAALEEWLADCGMSMDHGSIEIREAELDGVELAWAVRWSNYFRNWAVLPTPRSADGRQGELLGMCVEGVRVEKGTPGYGSAPFVAIGNATGPKAPKTNVARSGLEDTPQRLAALRAVYMMLCDEVSREITAMVDERGVSLTWATQEAHWLLMPLCEGGARSQQDLHEAVKSVPTLTVEDGKQRRSISPGELADLDFFWTLESNTFTSAERMLRELAANVSIGSLKDAFGSHDLDLPDGPVVSGYSPGSLESNLAFGGKEVSRFVIQHDLRRVDLEWSCLEDGLERWRIPRRGTDPRRRDIFDRYGRAEGPIMIGRGDIEVVGADGESAINAFNRLFVLPGTPVTDFVNGLLDEAESAGRSIENEVSVLFVESVLRDSMWAIAEEPERTEQLLQRKTSIGNAELARGSVHDAISKVFSMNEFVTALQDTDWKVFDPRQWLRSEGQD